MEAICVGQSGKSPDAGYKGGPGWQILSVDGHVEISARTDGPVTETAGQWQALLMEGITLTLIQIGITALSRSLVCMNLEETSASTVMEMSLV